MKVKELASDSVSDSAIDYGRRGWRVIPLHTPTATGCTCKDGENCTSAGKHPRILNWQNEASADNATIEKWWQRSPAANVGVVMGQASGIVDFEHDSHDGEQILLDLFDGELPITPTFKSSRGKHRLFRWREGLPQRATFSIGKLDIKIGNEARGSQCVFPPSRHFKGVNYEWLVSPDECDPPAISDSVVARIRAAFVSAKGASNSKTSQNGKTALRVEKIPDGSRNDTLYQFACSHARRFNLQSESERQDLFTIIAGVNLAKCSPPLDDHEVSATVTNAINFVRNQQQNDEVPSVASTIGQTEAVNARRLVAECGDDIHYVDQWGKWLVWDGKRWTIDHDLRLDQFGKQTANKLWQHAALSVSKLDEKSRAAMFSFCKQANKANGIANMIALARSEPGVPILPNKLDQDNWLLNVANGTIDLRSNNQRPHHFRSHDRADFITKRCPVAYDPRAECPTWLSFLNRIMAGNRELITYLQRLVGYSLTGDTSEHILPFCYGMGANGKSTFIGTIQELLGEDYAIKAATDLLLAKQKGAHPTEIADLHGRRFVACIEADDGRRMAESLVKEMTGGDKLRARRMREDFWEFHATHKVWLAANHKPTIRGQDYGIWRRVKLIPFTVTIPDDEQDKQLPLRLLNELSGILNWALAGCDQWQHEGLGEPEEVKAATNDYKSEMDIVGRFIDECCIIGDTYHAGATDLFKAFKDWGGDPKITQTKFGDELAKKGYPDDRYTTGPQKGRKMRRGIGLLDPQGDS